jgi:hypothetical protein
MWLPMVVGAILMTGLMVESWIRVAHIIPIHQEMRAMQKQITELQTQLREKE